MLRILTGLLCVLVVLCASSVYAAAYSFEKTGTGGLSSEITFQNTAYNNGGKTFFNLYSPVISGDNLYAPDTIKVGSQWYCYHGGWLTSGQTNDKIYLGISDDGDPSGSWSPASQLTINNGVYTHVNDPSVQKVGSTWYMVYTTYQNSTTKDWINYSTSSDGISWTPGSGSSGTEIAITDPLGLLGGGNTLTDIARPSLVKDGSRWLLYFDGKVNNGATHSYCATSTQTTPSSFTLAKIYDDVSGAPGFFEPDVERRPDGSFIAVYQRNYKKCYLATSADGLNFTGEKEIYDVNTPPLNTPETWVDNPGMLYDKQSDNYQGIMFGYTNNSNLTGNDIGFAVAQWIIQVRSPGDIWHGFASSKSFSEKTAYVFGYTSFDLVRLIDPVTMLTVYEQDFTSAAGGDTWTLQFDPDIFWGGWGATSDWTDTSPNLNDGYYNWYYGDLSVAPVPVSAYNARIYKSYYGTYPVTTFPTISSDVPDIKNLVMGGDATGVTSLTITSSGSLTAVSSLQIGLSLGSTVLTSTINNAGSLSTGTMYLGWQTGGTGTLNTSGTVNVSGDVYMGNGDGANGYGSGILHQTAGTTNISGGLVLGVGGVGSGHLQLDGGTITVGSIAITYGNLSSTVDITNGILKIAGDVDTPIGSLAGVGNITAFGGNGKVLHDYNVTNAGYTTVWACQSIGDFDHDCKVNFSDLSMFASNWLKDNR